MEPTILRHSGERAPAQVRVVNIREKTKIGDYAAWSAAARLVRRGLEALALKAWNSFG